MKYKLLALAPVNVCTGHICGHQVRGALDPRKLPPDGNCQSPRQDRLTDPRHIFDQEVPASEQDGRSKLYLLGLTLNHTGNVGD